MDVKFGTVDNDWRGNSGIIVQNPTPYSYFIIPGTRLAQGVIAEKKRAVFDIKDSKDELSKTERGENGFGKRTELDEYRVQLRGGKGVVTYKITPKTGKLVGVRIATDDEDVMLITDKGTIIRLKVKDISVLGRSTQGVTLMRTTDGGKVVSIETLTPDMEDIEE